MSELRTEIESKRDSDVIGRFLNANRKADQAIQRRRNKPGEERLVIAERYHVAEMQHTRRELFRRTKMHAWNEGHEAVCSAGRECEEHRNPYVLLNGEGMQ
jgi:hypothetical protein